MRPIPVGLLGRMAMPCNSQFTPLRDEHSQVLDADARSSRNDDDIHVRLKRFENRVAVIANQTREIDETSVALDQRSEHRPVGIGNMKAVRLRA